MIPAVNTKKTALCFSFLMPVAALAAMAKMFKAKPELMDLTSADVAKMSDADLAKVVDGGRNKMPSFKSKLKPGQIADVVAYVRTIARPAK